MPPPEAIERLQALGLMAKAPPPASKLRKARPEYLLRLLCEARCLQGGLSVALDVRPDELIGPLLAAIGGSARWLKVEDVRDRPQLEISIRFGELKESWAVPDVRALVHNLNDLFRGDETARAVAVLGDWEDALQLWALPKSAMRQLLQESFFEPENRGELAESPEG